MENQSITINSRTFIAKDEAATDFMQLLLKLGTLEQIASTLPKDARVAITRPSVSYDGK